MWNWTENQVKLVWIRHGATEANREHRYLGKTDEPLSEEGIRKLQSAKASKIYPDIDYLFSSPMKRCLETAEILYPAQKIIRIPDWEEMDFGAFEGKNYIDLQKDARYQAWIDSNGTLPFPEGESREEFIRRCEQGFYRMLKQLGEFKTVGMIVHGGTIMALMSQYYGGEYYDYQVANGEGYICTLKGTMEKPRFAELEKIKGE